LTVPHYELLAPEDSLAEFRGRWPETPYTGRGRGAGYPHDYAAQEAPRAATAAMITRLDRGVGRVLALLKDLDLDERTVIIFTSDNGPAAGASDPEFFRAAGPLRGHKGQLYEGGIRVPLIVRWPQKVSAGVVSDHVCHFADLLPTLAELAGAKLPAGVDGISLAPLLLGEEKVGRKQPEPEILYWEHEGAEAVRKGDWKGIRPQRGAPLELYDLARDVSETRDVAAEHPDVVREIEAAMRAAWREPPPQVEPEKPAGRRFR